MRLENGHIVALLYGCYLARGGLSVGKEREKLSVDVVDAAAQASQFVVGVVGLGGAHHKGVYHLLELVGRELLLAVGESVGR